MDTDRLRYFCAIYEAGSLSKAAEFLGISHSALSKAMSALQNDLDLTLFKPAGRGIEPTEDAEKIYLKSKEILSQILSLKEKTVSQPRILKIGTSELLGLCLTGKFATSLWPETFSLHTVGAGELEAGILDKTFDFGFSMIPFPQKNIEYLKLTKLRFGIFAKKEIFKNKEFRDLPFVIPTSVPKDNILNLQSQDGWPFDLKRKISYGSSSLSNALNIVLEGKACIFVPKILAASMNLSLKREYQLEEITSSKAATLKSMDLFLVKHVHADESQKIKKITREIRLLSESV